MRCLIPEIRWPPGSKSKEQEAKAEEPVGLGLWSGLWIISATWYPGETPVPLFFSLRGANFKSSRWHDGQRENESICEEEEQAMRVKSLSDLLSRRFDGHEPLVTTLASQSETHHHVTVAKVIRKSHH